MLYRILGFAVVWPSGPLLGFFLLPISKGTVRFAIVVFSLVKEILNFHQKPQDH